MATTSDSPADRDRIKRDLANLYRAAIAAVDPQSLVNAALAGRSRAMRDVPQLVAAASRVFLLAVGKASLAMACAIKSRLGSRLADSLVVVPPGTAVDPSEDLTICHAAHPLPDESSERAARRALDMLHRATASDLVIVALSGGASAMFTVPVDGVSLADKIAVNVALLGAGASIREFNTVRKHLSAVKGGALLRQTRGASVLTLILSDVPGNDLATIGSGLTAADPTTFADAVGVLKRRSLWGRAPESVRDYLERGVAGEVAETLKPGASELELVTNLIIGGNSTALDGLERAARELGYAVDRWRELYGEADDVGRALAAHLASIQTERMCIIAGGEPVVTVRGPGQGGRAQQCALATAIELARIAPNGGVAALLAGTDGIDGPTDAAGAFAFPDTVARAAIAGLSATDSLARNDAYTLFRSIGDLLVTGPTGTNVSDILVALINW
ncbi:MAG: glycerate kinase type-2 family protein [Candidatus Binataceae bacterium]